MVVIIPPPPLLRLIAIRVAAVFHLSPISIVVRCCVLWRNSRAFLSVRFSCAKERKKKKKNSLLSDCCGPDLCSGLLLVGVFLETLF